ncbi:MAG: biopolymer transporter Tol [Kiritimatiellia bacterium]|jgi:hypothetical protein
MNASLAACGAAAMVATAGVANAAAAPVAAWSNAVIRPVSTVPNRHSIHTYFNVSPESPDGRYVLFYVSTENNAEKGDLVVQERATGKETVVARDIFTEDAHRAACQQWMDGGRTIVYHDCRDGRWTVVAINLVTRQSHVLARDRQLGFGAAMGTQAPLYGCHWKPGKHRDLEFVDLRTGAIRTAVKADDVAALQPEWVEKILPENGQPVSIFFPVVSPDGRKVFFKLARGSGEGNFKTSKASIREGKFVYDLTTGRHIRFYPQWGHPSWHPDSKRILEKGNIVFDAKDGQGRRLPAMIPTDHPSFGPDGSVFVSDGKVTKADYAATGNLVVTVGSATTEEQARVDLFKSTAGARTWRKSHPHPVFSPDGKRIYYNVNAGPWTELRVAEIGAK